MAKKSNKKSLIVLLIVLSISIIGGGFWTYNSLRSLEAPPDYISGLQIGQVFDIKDEIILNIEDFLEIDILDNFYSSDQFNSLQDIDTEIDIDRYLNNPNPFVVPVSIDDDTEE